MSESVAAVASVVNEDLVICMRAVKNGAFSSDVGDTTFLKVPPPAPDPPPASPTDGVAFTQPLPSHQVTPDDWFDALMKEGTRAAVQVNTIPGYAVQPRGDVLIIVHGFNNPQSIIMQRHRQLRKDLTALGYNGAIASFDWPSGDSALGYVSDRNHAAAVAVRLVNDLVFPFAARVRLGTCVVNVHVLAHSTGAYLFQETVDMSDEHHGIADVNWTISQLLLIGADIDQGAMSDGHGDGESMIKHAVRVTNYSNPYDEVLKLSNVKRFGVDPRIGRVGLPADAPDNCVNVDCGDYFLNNRKGRKLLTYGEPSHSWQIGDPVWTKDLFLTITGDMDRSVLPTRAALGPNSLELQPP